MQKESSQDIPKLFSQKIFYDDRGRFVETFSQKSFEEIVEENITWKMDTLSVSSKAGTIRGLHFQHPPKAQAKIVRCGRGRIFDVAVDIRRSSDNFGKWYGFELSPENGKQLFIPVGFAHGFLALEDDSETVYKSSEYYCPESQGALRWDDPEVNIQWPLESSPILSVKDSQACFLPEFTNFF